MLEYLLLDWLVFYQWYVFINDTSTINSQENRIVEVIGFLETFPKNTKLAHNWDIKLIS